jgi:hypothetical protein
LRQSSSLIENSPRILNPSQPEFDAKKEKENFENECIRSLDFIIQETVQMEIDKYEVKLKWQFPHYLYSQQIDVTLHDHNVKKSLDQLQLLKDME